MPEIICNTSPIHYLHQINLLNLIPALLGKITIPPSVITELDAGRLYGISEPDLRNLDWIRIKSPTQRAALPMSNDLGPGETDVLALALENPGCVVILDDKLARQVASSLGIHVTGTLGLLLDGKRAGIITAVEPLLNELQFHKFRIDSKTQTAVLLLAGEIE